MNKKPNNHPKLEKSSLFRLIKDLWSFNKGKWILVFIAMAFMVVGNSAASIFIKNITAIIVSGTSLGFDAIKSDLLQVILTMAVIYVLSISSSILMNQLMAYVTQDSLYRIREKMFVNMEQLPIKYFDQNNIGDVMSYYTNDTDTLRQLISQGLTQIVQSFIMVVVLVCIMLTYSIWLAFIIFTGIFAMIKVTKKVGGNARSGFIAQQKAIAKVEGFVEEMMHGQKVIKVFCHEEEAKKDFDKLNEALNDAMYFANTNASRMGPIMGNIGNIMYVFFAFIGALLITLSLNGHNIYNLSITGLKVVSVDYFLPIVISFLTLARQFSINVNQVFQQFNQIVMASAAATRIYKLIDEPKEVDNGYVTLVNVKENENHELVETTERTGIWAWKHPHTETGEVTYKRLEGDIRMIDVDFGYSEDKIVLHNINLYALPGQKVAFVGSTGAGKTTITNLLNRFYDIADGKIRYDGININKIKKADLRRSLGIVLQDTNLFTGTVMENIRYGRLDATDEECIEAAKLANAHDFITRLPDGYNTMLLADGANLSQGQRQLLSIASAAVADAPVMILDEATSSIDTRTEQLVQKGTNELMKGRTVFFIAHRLSTVQNSDVIMVLENGEIIERGNHKELINKKGKYYQLYTGAYELE